MRCLLKSKITNIGDEVIAILMLEKEDWASGVHSNFWPFLSNLLIGLTIET